MTKKNFIIAALTIFIQYYDYHLFGFLATNIASHFFSSNDPAIQILYAYLIMSLAMMAKPVGAIIFGKIGDSAGRSNSFKLSLTGTAIASIVLFITPSYEAIGIFSALILLICRMVICTLVSSGTDGVRIYIFEHIAISRRSLGMGIATLFMQAGSLLASLSAWFFTLHTMPSYSWRLAFLIGGVLGLSMVFIMKISNFSDKDQMHELANFDHYQKLTLSQIIKNDYKAFLLCVLVAGSIGSTTQFIIIFFGTYNFGVLKIIDRSIMQQYISIAIGCYMLFSLIGGLLADKFGSYKVFNFATFSVLIMAFILSFQINEMVLNKWTFIIIACCLPIMIMPAAAIYKRSIPKVIRYRFFSLSHALGSVCISAPTAFVSTYIYLKTNIAWLPILYFIITIIMIFFSIYYLNKREFEN